jgi:hypothetical protein
MPSEKRDTGTVTRTMMRKPSCLISCRHPYPVGAYSARMGGTVDEARLWTPFRSDHEWLIGRSAGACTHNPTHPCFADKLLT